MNTLSPPAYVNSGDIARCRELIAKFAEIRKTPNGATSTDYAYWLRAALALIASCEKRVEGDVVSVAQQALQEDDADAN